ncbi:hypothetical protein ASG11_04305 [Sphingomonas sp. Leaf357]|nr:hypothetical protein ASG11_04305 [Sphingomonas sp. Leaf357]
MGAIGLYGWIQSNDGRSTGLFLLFLLAIQVIAPFALILPLVMLDIDHAPLFSWSGYALRYAPLVLAASIVWFAAQLWWHVETVKRAVGFEFVDDADEPRLCRTIEPLIILAGLPTPFVGVIESDARNAFACGVGHKRAVVVVTRGLVDALSDAELGGVLAHELSHVKNGDIRLMAAANIFMSALTRLHARNALRFSPIHGLVALAIPAILPLSLAATLIGRIALRAGQVSRLLIASSREFVADAQAAGWTKDPAALASALLKVDERYRIDNSQAENDAMMIAGESSGTGATHPTVSQRVAALARVTGSMVWNAPASPTDQDWTATTTRNTVAQARFGPRGRAVQAIRRVRQGDRENFLGLTYWNTFALVLTVGALIGIHWPQIGDAHAMAAKFDPRPIGTMIGAPMSCELSPFSSTFKRRCDAGMTAGAYREYEGQQGTLAGYIADWSKARRDRGLINADLSVASFGHDRVEGVYRGQSGRMDQATVLRTGDGMYIDANGHETYAPPVGLIIAETTKLGCFVRDPRPIESGLAKPLDQNDIASIASDLNRAASDTASGTPNFASISYYLDRRETLVDRAWVLYRQPGLNALRAALDDQQQRRAVERFRATVAQLGFPAVMKPVDRAKLSALLRNPVAFIPCRSLRAT